MFQRIVVPLDGSARAQYHEAPHADYAATDRGIDLT